MATELIAVGSTAANSSDVVVAAGTPVTVAMKGAVSAAAELRISIKDDAGTYQVVGSIVPSRPAVCITGPGTYRLSRVAGETCGAFSA